MQERMMGYLGELIMNQPEKKPAVFSACTSMCVSHARRQVVRTCMHLVVSFPPVQVASHGEPH